jgi:vitamin B12 transporter
MMFKVMSPPVFRAFSFAVLIFASPNPSYAQTQSADQVPELTVTADRISEPVGQTGASVTIIPGEKIEKLGSTNLADALRDVAGIQVVNAGGVGATTTVSLRGSQPGETLVLLDGVRIGSPTSPGESVDFGALTALDIERIEVLRGPQSALYGSDAMGGVINIITRKGSKTPKRSVTIQGGSYGTLSTSATMSGATDQWTYSLGVNALHSDGFPRYGYRISTPLVIGDGVTPLPALPADDPANKGGASGRFSYKASDSVTLDFGVSLFGDGIRFDNPYAFAASDVFSKFNYSSSLLLDAFVRATVDPTGSLLRSQLTAYANRTVNNTWETEGCYDATFTPFNCRSGYVGDRWGAEYQGDLNFAQYGGLTFGLKSETETASTNESPNPGDGSFNAINARQVTNSVYSEYRIALFQRLDLTLGGRIDEIEGGQTFATYRATAAYHIDETGTKLRASVGTGDKEATLYQRFSAYGTPDLLPEQSIGYDFGVDQKLFDNRLTLSATRFETRYDNLIGFAQTNACTPSQAAFGGCYYNVSRADTQGVELETSLNVLPGVLRAKATYTYIDARDLGGNANDLDAGRQIYGIPRNQGSLSLIYDGIAKLEIEPRLFLVGERLAENFQTFPTTNTYLGGYAKLDLLANYKVNDNLNVFARGENLTNAAYQETFGFGVAGRSYYAGLNYTW